jgi:regulator of protease activity HflC (stomatin/prohibitin superfamily)
MNILYTSMPYLIIIAAILFATIKLVPQQEAWIVERLGKFKEVLEPGLNFVIPFIDIVAYKHSLKEQAMPITPQNAISKDNVTLQIDGVLYVKVFDAKKASYGAQDPYYAIAQLAQTTMRSEIGKLSLDKTFEERDYLNTAIVRVINEASASWGMECLRYEIKDIHPPISVVQAMELQMAAERKKRAQILESEGVRQAKINNAEAEKAQVVLNSEAAYTDQVNRAKGEAEAIQMVAEATANSIAIIAKSVQDDAGKDAVSFKLAQGYIESFAHIAKHSNTIVIPAELSNPAGFITSALSIFNNMDSKGVGKKS